MNSGGALLLPSHDLLTWSFFNMCRGEWGWGGAESKLSDVSSYKDNNPIGSGPHPYDLIKLNYFL